MSLPYAALEIAFAEAVVEREELKAEVEQLTNQLEIALEAYKREFGKKRAEPEAGD